MGQDFYHGTKYTSISSISHEGLRASTSGRLGAGVYLTTKEEAFKIAKLRGAGTGVVVF